MPDSYEATFERLWKHHRRVVAFLRHLGLPADVAHDLAQETFLRVWKGMEQYRGEAEWAYVEQTARRLTLNYFRDTMTERKNRVSAEDELEGVTDPAPSPYARLTQDQQAAMLRDAIQLLRPGLREAVLLRLQGMQYEEIAQLLGITLNAVKSRLHEAQKVLREKLGVDLTGSKGGGR